MRRRKKAGTPPPIEELPILDTYCDECLKRGLRERQRQSPGGATCKFGHGGAGGIPVNEIEPAREKLEEAVPMSRAAVTSRELEARPPAGFEVREGDRLSISYNGSKLQIAPYTSVELDSGFYSRTLRPGDCAEEQWDRIYSYLERKALEKARAKLRSFAEELAKSKAIASGKA